MGAETGPLQRLTDNQVSARLAAYNPGGSLDRDLVLLRDNASELIAAEVFAAFGEERANRYGKVYEGKVDAAWIQRIADYGRMIVAEKISVPTYMAERNQVAGRIASRMCERWVDDPGMLADCVAAFNRLMVIETDIILAQVSLLEAIEAGGFTGPGERRLRAPGHRFGSRQH